MTNIQFAKRLQPLKSNVFADMDRAKAVALAAGREVIDLSLGSSDLPAEAHVLEAIAQSLGDRSTHGYLLFNGTLGFREAAANWYEQKFGIEVDPQTEVLPLIGSQEGTAHLPLAILNPGDFALLLDPGYPSHAGGVYLASGQIYPMPLLAENGFLPVFADIPVPVLAQSRMMVLSYPHNPTAAIAPLSFFQEAVAFCQQHNLVLVHDFPYVDLVFGESGDWGLGTGRQGDKDTRGIINFQSPIPNPQYPIPNTQSLVPSILQADPEKSVSIEFFTLSKSYNMGGFRIGYAIGNAQLINALRQVKAAVDFNQYRGILNGAIAALTGPQSGVKSAAIAFQRRRDAFINALHRIGWNVPTPEATMYIWAKLPSPWSENSVEFCTQLVKQTGVAVSPGAGFGKSGEGYVRFALVHEPPLLEIAVERMAEFLH
ncbi:MAG: LL-diaminopimelate aminotransferase [Nostoc sp. DedQUE08]|uniref:LL-diaminopimelate aminotransferase n=1 Tax=unclassified Nostoc TaxID=2593658 RepID=UPI002AD51C01|nr:MULTISPECIES: LL-diaminopimelate aminotransferase [unclassified Nostoc]MDZ8067989.1 LL-diaminopimelate aminotransferase [Nostoc sp. DedQUE08]MDZ8096221.1 LL-diaminopimelate aminotransferase [Nostoc sp. DedQUE05]